MKNLNFKHRIKLLSNEITFNEYFQEIETEVVHGEYWADIKTVQGKEFHTASTTALKNTVRFIMRYVPGVNNSMIIEYKDVRYAIEEILNDNMANKTLTIVAETKIGI